MKTCLIVDDSKVVRMVARKILEGLNFEIVEAEDGQQAIDACLTEMPAAVLLDWNMPVMTGIDLLRGVRADPELKSIPFLMITAEKVQTNIIEAVQAGVSGYLVKPFSPDTLAEKLTTILAKSS